MARKQFTGEELARANLSDLTTQELDEYFDKNKGRGHRILNNDCLARFWRRIIKSKKIFFIRFPDYRCIIIMADSEEDTRIQVIPSLLEGKHHCKNPPFNKSCDKCRAVYKELAEKLNNSFVRWLGWAAPDYNVTIHI